MCGEKLLVVPCVVPNGKVKFYLPQGEWLSFPDRQAYQGGKYYEDTLELTQMAVFVRKGDTLLLGPDVQHTEQDMSQLTAWPN